MSTAQRSLSPAGPATPDIDESALVWRAAVCRRGFRGCGLSYPAGIARFGAGADWLCRTKACTTVTSLAEFRMVDAAGISATRVTAQLDGGSTGIPALVAAGVGRFVVENRQQVTALAAAGGRRTQLIVELGAATTALVPAILAAPNLEVCGLRYSPGVTSSDPLGLQAIRDSITTMASLRRAHGVLLTHIFLDGIVLGQWCDSPRVLRRIADAYYDTAGDACEHHRYPRPAVSVTPSESSLLVMRAPSNPAR